MIWNLASKARTFRFVGHQDIITGVHFSPSGNLVATSSKDKTVRLWTPTLYVIYSWLQSGHLLKFKNMVFLRAGCIVNVFQFSVVYIVICLYVIEKEGQRWSKLIPLQCAMLLSPTMARDWWQHRMINLSKCGVFTGSASSILSTSTPTGCAVPGIRYHVYSICLLSERLG